MIMTDWIVTCIDIVMNPADVNVTAIERDFHYQ